MRKLKKPQNIFKKLSSNFKMILTAKICLILVIRETLHIQFWEIGLRYLLVFLITHLCEQEFSSLLVVKNKQRNCLDVNNDMRLAMSNIHPGIEKLVKEMQSSKLFNLVLSIVIKCNVT